MKVKAPIVEGLAYGVASFLAIDDTSPNYLMITSWVCFLAYLIARFIVESSATKNATLAQIARFGRLIGWSLIPPLALMNCIGSAQS